MVLAVVVIGVIILSYLYILWHKHILKFSHIPSPPTIPWLGSILHLETDPHKFLLQLRKFSKRYKNLYVLWLCNHPLIVTGTSGFLKHVLGSQELLNKSSFYQFIHDWLGTGLLTSRSKKWKKRRRAITPSFHFSILKDFFKIFQEHAKTFVANLQTVADDEHIIDIQKFSSLATLDIICETAMGVKLKAQNNSGSYYVDAVVNISEQIEHRVKSPWLWPHIIYQFTSRGKIYYESLRYLQLFTTDIINKQIEIRSVEKKEGNNDKCKERKNFLDTLLDLYDKGEIDVDGIREEVDTFMFEGHDTTASGISWTLYMLGKHPEVQRKLHTEIDNMDKNGDLMHEVSSLKYLDHVIKESLRLKPPVTIFSREVEEDTIIDGMLIPKQTSILIDVYAIHTDPEYWNEPESFCPSRFLEDTYLTRNPYCYIPFSAGPRNCIGQKFAMLELKVLLFYIMSSFEVKSLQNDDDIQASVELIHKSRNGLLLEFKNRIL